MKPSVTLEKLVSLCKRRGFAFPSADIYGGLNGVYDLGPYGAALKQNIRNAWSASISADPLAQVFMMEGSLLGSEQMWIASGHVANFHDPLVDCLSCKCRFRADDIDTNEPCPQCGKKQWTEAREFQLMFKTSVGAASNSSSIAYLRPETAQAIFVNFKNVMSSCRGKIPFGIAQIGKAFRNEITPKQFLFRMREFEQMEIEWFCTPDASDRAFSAWLAIRQAFYASIGISPEKLRIRAHESNELAHYAKNTSDVEYEFPFGWKELEGVAHRGDFDLRQHATHSGKELSVFDEAQKAAYYPHVVECSVGVDRLLLALLCDSYDEEVLEDEVRIVLRLSPALAPVKAAFMPLTKTQNEGASELYRAAREAGLAVQFDASGSIGKRYRRQDEVGTPFCITYDFDTEQDGMVTIRFRDSMAQERMALEKVIPFLREQTAYKAPCVEDFKNLRG